MPPRLRRAGAGAAADADRGRADDAAAGGSAPDVSLGVHVAMEAPIDAVAQEIARAATRAADEIKRMLLPVVVDLAAAAAAAKAAFGHVWSPLLLLLLSLIHISEPTRPY